MKIASVYYHGRAVFLAGVLLQRCSASIVTGYRRWTAIGISARFMRDQSGSYAVMFGLLAPIFIGALALGSETGLWYSTQEKMQGAADSSAISAAVGLNAGNTNYALQADATAATYGYVAGSNGTTISVNKPPLTGPNVATPGAVEVIIKQPQTPLFSGLFLKSPVVVQGRAVAGPAKEVTCVLALSQTPLVSLVTGIAAAAFANVLADQCTVADNSPGSGGADRGSLFLNYGAKGQSGRGLSRSPWDGHTRACQCRKNTRPF